MTFAAFGLHFGNLTREPRPRRVPMPELVRGWNLRLADRAKAGTVVHWYRHTGNFVVQADADVVDVTETLREVSAGERFALFPLDDFTAWVNEVIEVAKYPPPAVAGRRWTPGMVMDLDPGGSVPPLPPMPRPPVLFGEVARARLRVAWRNDALRPGTHVLDNKRREGGWSKVGAEMSRCAGGVWTARALSTATELVRGYALVPSVAE